MKCQPLYQAFYLKINNIRARLDQRHIPLTPATQEAEIRRILV
jgi:hypothetical protein